MHREMHNVCTKSLLKHGFIGKIPPFLGGKSGILGL